MPLYLASQSPRRAELLSQIGVSFSIVQASIDETPLEDESASSYVARMATEKSVAGYTSTNEGVVLGSDTTVVLDGHILGKPETREDAMAMLSNLSGQTHQVMTAVCLTNKEQQLLTTSITDVRFRELTAREIRAYCDTDEPMDKAGAYGIQGKGAIFVEHISGSYSGVVGLPLTETYLLLQQMDMVNE